MVAFEWRYYWPNYQKKNKLIEAKNKTLSLKRIDNIQDKIPPLDCLSFFNILLFLIATTLSF